MTLILLVQISCVFVSRPTHTSSIDFLDPHAFFLLWEFALLDCDFFVHLQAFYKYMQHTIGDFFNANYPRRLFTYTDPFATSW
jgi:hypothetical protein